MRQKKPSISMPAEMRDEAEERREKGESFSKYVRDALRARFQAEDAGEWTDPTDDESEEVPSEA